MEGMAPMLSKTYDALRAAGAPDDKARAVGDELRLSLWAKNWPATDCSQVGPAVSFRSRSWGRGLHKHQRIECAEEAAEHTLVDVKRVRGVNPLSDDLRPLAREHSRPDQIQP